MEKGYKETKIGSIPEDWNVVTLGDVCQRRKDKFDPQKSQTVHPYIGLEHIESDTHRIISIGKF